MKTKLLTLALALAVVPTLAACGSDDNDKSDTTGKKAVVIRPPLRCPATRASRARRPSRTLPRWASSSSSRAPAAGTPVPRSWAPTCRSTSSSTPVATTLHLLAAGVQQLQARWAPTTQVIVTRIPWIAQCGKVDTTPRPSIARRLERLPAARLVPDKVHPIGDAASVTMVGLVYGYRAGPTHGAFDAVKAGKLKPVDVYLQSICLAGSLPATAWPRATARSPATRRGPQLAAATKPTRAPRPTSEGHRPAAQRGTALSRLRQGPGPARSSGGLDGRAWPDDACPNCGHEVPEGTGASAAGPPLAAGVEHSPGGRAPSSRAPTSESQPRIVSSLFPQLPRADMVAFRVALLRLGRHGRAGRGVRLFPVVVSPPRCSMPLLTIIYFYTSTSTRTSRFASWR